MRNVQGRLRFALERVVAEVRRDAHDAPRVGIVWQEDQIVLELLAQRVLARPGRLRERFVDDDHGSAFAVVSRKEGEKDSQVLPYRALSRDTEGKFTIAMPAEELKKAPRVTGIAALEKPETVKAIHDFFKEVIQKRPTATGHAPKGQG